MKFQLLAKVLATTLIGLGGAVALQQPSRADDIRFYCDMSYSTGVFTTYYSSPSRGKTRVPVVRWNSQYFSGSGYTPEQRCQEVTGRFQKAANSQALSFVTTGYVNGLPVVCASGRGGCNNSNILFTLKPREDASLAVQKLFNLSQGKATASPLWESSTDDNSVSINMNEFLNNTPDEAGVAAPNSPALSSPSSPSNPSAW